MGDIGVIIDIIGIVDVKVRMNEWGKLLVILMKV